MGAVRERALERNFKCAELIEKWEVRAMRRNGEKIIFLGYYRKREKKYAVYICDDKSYITVSKKSG